jgi:hypothetical protein
MFIPMWVLISVAVIVMIPLSIWSAEAGDRRRAKRLLEKEGELISHQNET